MNTAARLWDSEALTVTQPGLTEPGSPINSWQLFLVVSIAAASVAPWSLGRFRRVRAQYVVALEERARLEDGLASDRMTHPRH